MLLAPTVLAEQASFIVRFTVAGGSVQQISQPAEYTSEQIDRLIYYFQSYSTNQFKARRLHSDGPTEIYNISPIPASQVRLARPMLNNMIVQVNRMLSTPPDGPVPGTRHSVEQHLDEKARP
ncbi:hypothetical protein ANO11243_095900 [Dothideomycetidae sp. 11243]|nr:hypothetical protein ANO11243_095900 [fungal sp. No.11243]